MRAVAQIYARDLRRIATNSAAAVIVAGLVALPSLYAWFNIEASWDPYAQTGRLPVAVVNEDTGTTVRGTPVNIGKEVVAALRQNPKIGWEFKNEAEAMRGVKDGDDYAAIVIPPEFSARLATVLEETPRAAEIDYYVNEKINAIAPKITSSGATGIVEEVSSRFVETANGIIFNIFNQVGSELAALQSLIVSFGDIWLLGAHVSARGWFVLFGIGLSLLFMLLVYTLVSVFGNVGKAMAIVLLVLQLGGAGGTFPIQLAPAFFRAIHPFLPFTYGIGLMREAVGGILWDAALEDMGRLCAFAAGALIVGLALKRPMDRLTAGMVARARESRLIH